MNEYDIFSAVVKNPDASFDDIVLAGLTTNNSSLKSKEEYQNMESVRVNFTDSNNKFNQEDFDKAYQKAQVVYNNLANSDYEESLARSVVFHRDNIFVEPSRRKHGPDYREFESLNPYHISSGVHQIGIIGERNKSIDELAQTNKVLLNPTTAGDNLENAEWAQSPNESLSFWKYFFDTLVLAQYDEDGIHKDPITGEEIEHKAGDLKLDQNGDFYYEKLDGRDIYGRKVLNKMDIITEDGSWANQFDFFDSDGMKQKSVGASILKNLALVGTMYLPWVGPIITSISIGTQLLGLGATFYKMLTGSDSPTASAIEGWAKSVDRHNQTEYAQEHAWCWENMINLVGDVAAQLKEQRFIFEKAPMLFRGKFTNLMSQEGRAKELAKFQAKEIKIAQDRVAALKNVTQAQKVEAQMAYNMAAQRNAQQSLEAVVKSYQKIGEIAGKAYMTGITISDTYGEAKHAGASDIDATLLTLGYAAAEYALLSTGLGEHIMPELRANRARSKAIAEALAGVKQETQSVKSQLASLSSKEGKKTYVQKLFNIGKNIARAEYANGTKTLKASVASGIGEGLEEVSEEVLADFSKGCYDVVKWLQGDNSSMLTSFGYNPITNKWDSQDVLTRYGMSLVGGFIGGSLNNIGTNYSVIKQYNNITTKAAQQELINMIRNKEIDQFMRDIQGFSLGNNKLSATQLSEVDGQLVYAQGTEEDNQDFVIKKAIATQVNMLQNILEANGADISDQSFLDRQTLNDLRFTALSNSTTAGAYLENFNQLTTDIAQLTLNINSILDSQADTNQDGMISDYESRRTKLSDEQKKKLSKLEKELKEKQKTLQDLLDGKKSYDFIATALFEMTPALSGLYTTPIFTLYAENMFKKPYDQLSENEKQIAGESYNNWKQMEGREQIQTMADIYRRFANSANSLLTNLASSRYYKLRPYALTKLTEAISNLYADGDLNNISYEGFRIRNAIIQAFGEVDTSAIDPLIAKLENIIQLRQQGKATVENNEEFNNTHKQLTEEFQKILSNNLDSYLGEIINDGFATEQMKEHLEMLINEQIKYLNKKASDLQFSDQPNVFSEFNNTMNQINSYKQRLEEIKNLQETPLEAQLKKFSISIGTDPISISDIEKQLSLALYNQSEQVSDFNIDEDLLKNLNNAINVLQIYISAIRGARTDSASFGNYFGYNATLNEISKKQKLDEPELAEIDSETADLFSAEAESILNKLEFYKKLHYYNQGQKLSKQDRIATKKDLLIYKRLRSIVTIPNDDPLKQWNGFNEFQQAIQSLSLHEQLLNDDKTSLGDNKEKFEKETLQLDDAIYDFFQKNQDKLTDINSLKQLINTKRFNIFNSTEEILNEDSSNLNDNSIIWYLASRAALKSSDFYSAYKEIIDTDTKRKIAPIPTQELAVYNNYAMAVAGDTFMQIFNAYRQSLKEDWKNMTIEQRKQALSQIISNNDTINLFSQEDFTNYVLNIIPAPRYQNIALTEGIPGAGKSSAVFTQTVKLLQKYHPDLLKNAIVVHGGSDNSAFSLKESIGIENAVTYGRTDFMKSIAPQWSELSKNEDGTLQVSKNDYGFDSDYEVRSKLGVLETSIPSSVIFIDEIQQFSTYDVDLIDKFARKYGITVFAAGDFDQNTLVGKQPIEINSKQLTYYTELVRNNFIRSPKLGVSMRTDNTIKTKNISALQAFANSNSKQLALNYLEDESGIYGDVVINYIHSDQIDDINSEKNNQIPQIEEVLNKFITTLQSGQKIGYVYNDSSSPIYQLLQLNKYKQYINFYQGNKALGLEGQYYIIEADYNSDRKEYLRNLYTGISRSSQGSLVITPFSNDLDISSKRVNFKVNESVSDDVYVQYAQRRKKLLTNIITDANKIEYKPRTKEDNIQSVKGKPIKDVFPATIDNTPPKKQGKQQDEEQKTGYEDDQSPINLTPITIKEIEIRRKIDQANEGEARETSLNEDDGVVHIDMTLHSFNTFEIGVLGEDDNGFPIQNGAQAELRIDSMNGLIKLDQSLGNKVRKYSEYLKILGELRSLMFNIKDKSELIQKTSKYLSRYFGNQTDSYITFALKASPYMGLDKRGQREYVENKGSKYSKGVSERILFNGSSDARSDEVNTKSIVAIIGNKSGDIIELPLLTLTSPFTAMQARDGNGGYLFNEVKSRFIQLYKEGKSIHDISNTIVSEFGNNTKYKELIDLFRLYNETNRGIKYINDDQWTIAGSLINHGPQFVTDRGVKYDPKLESQDGTYQFIDGMMFHADQNAESEWITIDEFKNNPAVRVTSKVLIAREDVSGVKAGHPFVLISYDTSINSDSAIVKRFEDEQEDSGLEKKIQLAYVLPPTVSIDQYLENIETIFSKSPNTEHIGQLFTSYQLLKILTQDKSFTDYLDSHINKGLSKKVKEAVDALNTLPDNESIKNALYTTYDWTDVGILSKSVRLAGLFDNVINQVSHNKRTIGTTDGKPIISRNEEGIKLINDILTKAGVEIRYNMKIPKNATKIGSFFVGNQQNGYKLAGIPFKIHGKIDSQTFSGNMGALVSEFLSDRHKFNNQGNTIYISNDSRQYLSNNSRLSQIKNEKDSIYKEIILNQTNDDQRIIETAITNLAKIGISFDINQYSNVKFENVKTLLNTIQSDISKQHPNILSFTDGNNLYIQDISELRPELNFPKTIVQQQSNVYEIFSINNTSAKYTAEWDKNTHTLSIIKNEEKIPAVTITDEELNSFKDSINLLETLEDNPLEIFTDLRELLNLSLKDIDSISTIFSDLSESIDILEEEKENSSNININNFYETLINLVKRFDPKNQQDTCPVPFKICF